MPDLGMGDVFRAITAIRKETPDLAWMLDVPGVGNQLIRLGAGEIAQQEFAAFQKEPLHA